MLQQTIPLQEQELIYALDIGTRSVIGMLGVVENERLKVEAIEKLPHEKRAMLDGQIEDIHLVAKVVAEVTRRLEKASGRKLVRASVAAAGRSLCTERGEGSLSYDTPTIITEEQVNQLEALAVAKAEETLTQREEERRLFLVGYTALEYRLDDYPIKNLVGHTGQHLTVEVVATFLPSEVVDSLYAVMRHAELEVASLTLEPIAALNAAIPSDIRLLNLALVDIGAGTSDIAICREGSVVGYTMATVAGDEITEALMKGFLVDYATAERIKVELPQGEPIVYTDILGLEQTVTPEDVEHTMEQAVKTLVEKVSKEVLSLNGGAPSALFLAGGGSKLANLTEKMGEAMGMDSRRIALSGAHFKRNAFSDAYDLNDPEYTTPLGIAISAGLGLISDSYRVFLNEKPAKLFRSGRITLLELLMMNGYAYRDLIGRTGRSITLTVDGKRQTYYGEPATPARIILNGQEVQPTALIHAGDKITFEKAVSGKDRVVTAGEVMAQLKLTALYLDGKALSEGEQLTSGMALVGGMAEKPHVPAAEPVPVVTETPPATIEPPKLVERCHFILNGRPLLLTKKPDGVPYYLMDLLEYSGIDFQHLSKPVRLSVNGKLGTFQQILMEHDQIEITVEE